MNVNTEKKTPYVIIFILVSFSKRKRVMERNSNFQYAKLELNIVKIRKYLFLIYIMSFLKFERQKIDSSAGFLVVIQVFFL